MNRKKRRQVVIPPAKAHRPARSATVRQTSKIGITTGDIAYGSSGIIAITRRVNGNPVDTGERMPEVFNDHMTRQTWLANTEVDIKFYADERVWRIVGGGCDPLDVDTPGTPPTPPVAGF